MLQNSSKSGKAKMRIYVGSPDIGTLKWPCPWVRPRFPFMWLESRSFSLVSKNMKCIILVKMLYCIRRYRCTAVSKKGVMIGIKASTSEGGMKNIKFLTQPCHTLTNGMP